MEVRSESGLRETNMQYSVYVHYSHICIYVQVNFRSIQSGVELSILYYGKP